MMEITGTYPYQSQWRTVRVLSFKEACDLLNPPLEELIPRPGKHPALMINKGYVVIGKGVAVYSHDGEYRLIEKY